MTDRDRTPQSTPEQAGRVTPAFEAAAAEIIARYPVSKRSAALPLLHLWQKEFGFIDDSGVGWIADKLALTPVNIFELVTFYPWFRREACGRTVIRVCRTLACALAGSEAVKEKFCEATGIDPHAEHEGYGEAPPTSPDGKFSVEFVECLASCGSAPVALVGDELHENIRPSDIPAILKSCES